MGRGQWVGVIGQGWWAVGSGCWSRGAGHRLGAGLGLARTKPSLSLRWTFEPRSADCSGRGQTPSKTLPWGWAWG